MRKLKLIPSAASLTGLLLFGGISHDKTLVSPTNDGSVAAITNKSAALPLDKIILPSGFSISVYAEVEGARSMVMSPSGTLFVGTQRAGKVYAVKDNDGDHVADKKWTIVSGLNNPNGVAVKNGALNVAEISKITKFSNIEQNLDNPGKGTIIYDKFPTDWPHGWKYIAFGPDGKLYVPVGAPFNIGEPAAQYASLFRMNDDGTGFEKFASGYAILLGSPGIPRPMSYGSLIMAEIIWVMISRSTS